MKLLKLYLSIILSSTLFVSCLSTKDVRFLQANENLTLNDEGLIPYNIPVYRINRNDMLNLQIITTPKGDAAQFYSSLYASSSGTTGNSSGIINSSQGNSSYYFNGLKLNSKGNIYVFGIGEIPAEGRTTESIQEDIQKKVNENFLEGKSEVRLNLDGITYYILGDIEGTGITGEKKSYTPSLTLMEAFAQNGGLNKTIDRKNIVLQRKYPEGMKRVHLDLTREDIMNSPYFWVQNGDMIYLNTRAKSMYGFGQEPLQTLSTGVSLFNTALSLYLLITRL